MLEKDKAPIPIPFRRRWKEYVHRYVPMAVMGGAMLGIVALWKQYILPVDLTRETLPPVPRTLETNRQPAPPQSNTVVQPGDLKLAVPPEKEALKLPDPQIYLKTTGRQSKRPE